jgi:hypothetical protein
MGATARSTAARHSETRWRLVSASEVSAAAKDRRGGPQGNRVNELSPDDANQKLIVPSSDLPPQA